MQEISIRPYEQIVYAQPRICPGEWHAQNPLGFWDTNGSPNLCQTTRPYNNQQKKRTFKIVDFAVPAEHRVMVKESKRRISTRTLRGNWKNLEHENECTNYNWCFSYCYQRISKRTRGLRNKKTIGDNPNCFIIEKSPGDLRRLVVTQSLVKDHQLTLMWKTFKE